MAGHTPRFGLNTFGPGQQGTITDEGQKYTGADRLLIDRLLAQVEAHDHRARLVAGPALAAPSPTQGSAGSLQAGQQLFYRYAVIQADGTETLASPIATTTLPAMLPVPAMPALSVDPLVLGTLAPGYYMYALTALRGSEETPVGPVGTITVIVGEGAVTVALPPLGAADAYRVWRMGLNDPGFTRLGLTSGAEFVDSGSVPPDPCAGDYGNTPPLRNTGVAVYSVVVALPVDTDLTSAAGWKLYRSTASTFGSASLVHYVVERADQIDPTSPLLTSWEDVGDPLVSGAPMDADLNMRFSPFVFDAAAELPSASGYPEHYPLVFDGALYWKDGGDWVQLAGAAVSPGAAAGSAPGWFSDDLQSLPTGAPSLAPLPSAPEVVLGAGASAFSVVDTDAPAGRAKSVSFNIGSSADSYCYLSWNSGVRTVGVPMSVRFLYRVTDTGVEVTVRDRATFSSIATLPQTAVWAWSDWISIGTRTALGHWGIALQAKRATASTAGVLHLAGIELIDTSLVGALAPTDGYLVNDPRRGQFRYDYATGRWATVAPMAAYDQSSFAFYGGDGLSHPIASGASVYPVLPALSAYLNSDGPLDDVVFFPGSWGAVQLLLNGCDATIATEVDVTGLNPGDRVRLYLRDRATTYLNEGPHGDAVVGPGETTASVYFEHRVRAAGIESQALQPHLQVISPSGSPVLDSFSLTACILSYGSPYPPPVAPVVDDLTGSSPAAGTLRATWAGGVSDVPLFLMAYRCDGTGSPTNYSAAASGTHDFTGLAAGWYVVTAYVGSGEGPGAVVSDVVQVS